MSKTGRQPARTKAESATIQAEEDRVVRMRHGLRFPADRPLPDKAGGSADILAQLKAIELAAFEKSGRLEELRREAEAEDEAEAQKDKIVDALSSDD
jgi:hypothetical protein